MKRKTKLVLSMLCALGITTLSSCMVSTGPFDDLNAIYEMAKKEGFEGTYEEWLDSLKGDKGQPGEKGEPGKDGRSVVSIKKTSTKDNIDTYTITYSDGETSIFTVTNGQDGTPGKDGIDGEPGTDGHTPKIEIGTNGNWIIDDKDTGIKAEALHTNDKFKVTYHLNGGSLPAGIQESFEVGWGDTIDLPLVTKRGYEFTGWYTGKTVNDKKFTSYDAVFRNLDLYANFFAKTYTVNLDLNGGSYNGNTNLKFEYDSNYRLPTNITKKNYEFTGWSLNGKIIPNEGIYTYEDITLVATYKELDTIYTLTLNSSGGTIEGSDSFNLKIGDSYSLPTPMNSGKAFAGWYDGEFRWENDGYYAENRNLTLAAKRITEISYTFSLNYMDGTSSEANTQQITLSEMYNGKTMPVPTKANHTFVGYAFGNNLITDETGKFDMEKVEHLIKEGNTYSLIAKYASNNTSTLADYIYLGSYPQSRLIDGRIFKEVLKSTDTDGDGFINHSSGEYAEFKGKYFKVEPILWYVGKEKKLLSNQLLDISTIYQYNDSGIRNVNGVNIQPTNYKYSEARAFLNGYDGTSYNISNYENKGFYQSAFNDNEKALIAQALVDNSVESIGLFGKPEIACEDTQDYVYLPSCTEMQQMFGNNYDRIKSSTDYMLEIGNTYGVEQGDYLTRSPSGKEDIKVVSRSGSVGQISNWGFGVFSLAIGITLK